MVIEINENNFDSVVLKSDVPVLVDFWAPWCGPCKMLGPVMEGLTTKTKDTAKICKLNVDESPNLAAKFGISSIPTVIVFKNARVSDQFVGVQSETTYLKALS